MKLKLLYTLIAAFSFYFINAQDTFTTQQADSTQGDVDLTFSVNESSVDWYYDERSFFTPAMGSNGYWGGEETRVAYTVQNNGTDTVKNFQVNFDINGVNYIEDVELTVMPESRGWRQYLIVTLEPGYNVFKANITKVNGFDGDADTSNNMHEEKVNMLARGKVPNFIYEDVDGKIHNMYDYLSHDTLVMIHFFSSTCGSCEENNVRMLEFVDSLDALGIPVQIVGMSARKSDTKEVVQEITWVQDFPAVAYHNTTYVLKDWYRDNHQGVSNGPQGYVLLCPDTLNPSNSEVIFSDYSMNSFSANYLDLKVECYDHWVDPESLKDTTDTTSESISDLTMGIEKLNVFPNPVNEKLNIALDLSQTTNMDVEIVDVIGNIVKTGNYTLLQGRNQVVLSLAELNTGMYFVRLKNGDRSRAVKIMVN